MPFNLDEFVKKYKVHKETIGYLSAKFTDGIKQGYETGVEGARLARIEGAKLYGGTADFEGTEREIFVPSAFSTDGVPVTIYRPTLCDVTSCPPILVYFHGGGSVVASRKTHETVCKVLARDSPCIVVNVEYRLAPEHKFPACQDDAKSVVDWVTANKVELGGKPNSKVGVCGDSAGGRISAVVCHEAKDLIDFAVLVYPGVNFKHRYPSEEEFKDGPALSRPVRDWYTSLYLNNDADKCSVRASPILNTDFSDHPPTLIVVAELDPLRDGCYAYSEKLKESGTEVELVTIKGVPHGFWSLSGAFPTTCQDAYSTAVRFIQKHSK